MGGGDGEDSSNTQETCVHVLVSVCVCSQREMVGEVKRAKLDTACKKSLAPVTHKHVLKLSVYQCPGHILSAPGCRKGLLLRMGLSLGLRRWGA